jgi:hypothetical protein
MPRTVSGIDQALDYEAYVTRFGVGPCGVYAAVRREHGWGQVAFCEARVRGGPMFGHYVIVTDDGGIIDLTNPTGEELEYIDVEPLAPDEMPDWDVPAALTWMRKCLRQHKAVPVYLLGAGWQGAVGT